MAIANYGLNSKDRTLAKRWSAGLYLRLSRDDDKYESESISSQRDILYDFVERNNDIDIYDTYIDDGWSGTNFDRPDFKRMEDDLRAKKIDCIIVKDLSRFARNCIEIGNYLSIVFPYLKTRFICINDNVDSYLDPESLDNLSTKFKNLINDEYCRDISVKVRSSLTIRRKNGEYIGSFACYGYKKDSSDYHKLVIDEEPAEIIRGIYSQFIAGRSIRAIVRELNEQGVLPPALYKKKKYPNYNPSVKAGTLWTQRIVKRILTNRMYLGDMVQRVMSNISYRIQKCRPVDEEKQIIVPNTHEAIISREDFLRVSDLLKRDTYESPKTKQVQVLSGFIKCGDCRRGMIRKTLNNGWKTYQYFICSTYKNRSKVSCTKHTIDATKVEQAVFSFIKANIAFAVDVQPILERINNSGIREKKSEKWIALKKSYMDEMQKYRSLREDLYPDYKEGLIDRSEYDSFRAQYEIKIVKLEDEIKKIEAKINEIAQGVLPENAFIKNFREFHSISELTREVVCALIENIYVYEGGRIEIVMKYRDEYDTVIEYLNNNTSLAEELLRRHLSGDAYETKDASGGLA